MVVGYALIMGSLAIGLGIRRRSASRSRAADAHRPASAPAPAGTGAGEVGTGTSTRRRRALAATAQPAPGWRRLSIHYLATAVGGYLLLMSIIILYYYGVAPIAGNFVESAFSGCALLIALSAPVFLAASWLAERKGWRI